MVFGIKKFMVALSALLFSVGHSACACLPQSSAVAPSAAEATPIHEMGGHSAHHGASRHGASEDGGAPCGPTNESCAHCQLAQFASAPDAAKLQTPTPAKAPLIAILSSITSREAPTLFLKAAARLHWAAPPGATPVSLKIRLLI